MHIFTTHIPTLINIFIVEKKCNLDNCEYYNLSDANHVRYNQQRRIQIQTVHDKETPVCMRSFAVQSERFGVRIALSPEEINIMATQEYIAALRRSRWTKPPILPTTIWYNRINFQPTLSQLQQDLADVIVGYLGPVIVEIAKPSRTTECLHCKNLFSDYNVDIISRRV